MLLSTEAPSQLIPVNLVTRPSLSVRPGSDRPGPHELPDDDDAVIIDAEVTEPSITTTSIGKIFIFYKIFEYRYLVLQLNFILFAFQRR